MVIALAVRIAVGLASLVLCACLAVVAGARRATQQFARRVLRTVRTIALVCDRAMQDEVRSMIIRRDDHMISSRGSDWHRRKFSTVQSSSEAEEDSWFYSLGGVEVGGSWTSRDWWGSESFETGRSDSNIDHGRPWSTILSKKFL